MGATSELSEALEQATFGARMPGETVSLAGLTRFDGTRFEPRSLPSKVRVFAFIEPLDRPAGLKRLAWWKANARSLSERADVIVVPSASPRSNAQLEPLIAVDDVDCLLAARFGAIRLYSGKLGALPLAFVVDDSNIVRAIVDVEAPADQLVKIDRAVGRLRQQLSEQNVSFGY